MSVFLAHLSPFWPLKLPILAFGCSLTVNFGDRSKTYDSGREFANKADAKSACILAAIDQSVLGYILSLGMGTASYWQSLQATKLRSLIANPSSAAAISTKLTTGSQRSTTNQDTYKTALSHRVGMGSSTKPAVARPTADIAKEPEVYLNYGSSESRRS